MCVLRTSPPSAQISPAPITQAESDHVDTISMVWLMSLYGLNHNLPSLFN